MNFLKKAARSIADVNCGCRGLEDRGDLIHMTSADSLSTPPKSSMEKIPDSRDNLRGSSSCRASSHLKDAEESAETVQKMIDLLKFNNEQCKYLCDKLRVVIQSAREEVETTSRKDDPDFVKIFELLMVLGKQIESFVEGCCSDKWVQAAVVLTNVSEYVSSLAFNLDLCKIAFGKDRAASGNFTLDEVDDMKKPEARLVKQKASVDAKELIKKVKRALKSLRGDDKKLASHLLERLLWINRYPSSGNGTFLSNLFKWVESGQQVGRGGTATVYEAMWLGVCVAMKTFPGSEVEEFNEDFENEIRILSQLCHPNITSMFCCTRNKRNCSIVMELMDGDLNQLMDKRCQGSSDSCPFPILEAVDIMLQIGEGVNYLHNKCIVHRDLKSKNILYKGVNGKKDEIGFLHVKVADFGLSKARDTNSTYSDLTCNTGTARWMPPEVIRISDGNRGDLPVNPDLLRKDKSKLDSYSFGLLCYEILVGKVPFSECKNNNEVKRKILKKERPILPCTPSKCPPMLKALIEKCWSHEPEERPNFGVICRELTYIKYSLIIGGSMKHGVDDSRTRENIAHDKSAISDSGHLDGHSSSLDSLMSPQISSHSSIQGAENVEIIAHSELRRSESGHFDSRGHSQPGSHYLPTATAPVAPEHGGKVTEVMSRSFQKSFGDNTPADCFTLPPKSSMEKIPISRDRLRSSSYCRARSYLMDAEKSAQAVEKMSEFIKFNKEQCNYLFGKLCVAIQSAGSFLDVPGSRQEVGTASWKDDTDFVQILELVMVSGKQIESFVGGCCMGSWILSAMMLTNVSEYVSSLGFNLDLCKVALGEDHAASGRLTLDEVDGMKESEAELVRQKAFVDAECLTKKVKLALNYSASDADRDLANHLLRRLSKIKFIPSSGSGLTFWSNLFAWVKLEKRLGCGAAATVYKAMWLGTRVAVKKFEGSNNEEFEKEVEILSRLCHPNITSMFCCTKNKRICSIVMELMDGDLNQLIDERCQHSSDSRPFPILEAVDIMLQIGEGVNYLHDQGIVHRDLKVKNILYKSVNGKNVAIGYVHVKVGDFGLSKARDTRDLTRNTGTNRWMPPEVIGMSDENQRGMVKYPFKLDSYSFGLVCYEILVGHVPFWECTSIIKVKRKILKKERPRLPSNPSECPLMLKTLIEKCWSHEPEERPTFGVICKVLTFVKYSLMTGGSTTRGVDEVSESVKEELARIT